jgi:cytochrome c-type biogenesis protein CcsB|uniref:cytochrome c biogenesis protein n=1 Tax=Gonyostomum semen TaxID=375454 RepID=UPI002115466F|nr:cytochrome c biogenesis protein [Gonyostomum semen]UTE94397.1 cytochrome c biogenesis protein [Gonyostomum semen]
MIFDLDNYQNFLSNTTFLLLLLTMLTYWVNLIFVNNNIIFRVAKLSGSLATIILFSYLSWRWYNYKFFPLSNLYESLIFLTCLLLLLYKFIEYKTKSKIIGSLIIPLTLLIQGFATLSLPTVMQKSSPLVPALQSNWLMLHVSMMMLSYATLLFGSLFSILYLILDKNNNNKIKPKIIETDNLKGYQTYALEINTLDVKSNNLYIDISTKKNNLSTTNLLESLDNWSYRTIGLGFPLLTMGIISGAVWANEAWGSYWSWDPKETWALITWLTFAIYLHVRLTKGWLGTKSAILGSIGFFVVWVCYLGVNFLGKGLHSYGWVN